MPSNHHRIHAHQLHQHDILGEAALQRLVHHRRTTIFQHYGLVVKMLDIRQRIGKNACRFHGGSWTQGHGLGDMLRTQ
jgi:hypothetical protein